MRKSMRILVVAVAILLVPSIVFAASPWTTETSWSGKATKKLIFGTKNLLGGWTELFSEPMNYHKEGKNVAEGIVKGFVNAIVFTIGGALHVVTFPIPQVDLPLPDNGVKW